MTSNVRSKLAIHNEVDKVVADVVAHWHTFEEAIVSSIAVSVVVQLQVIAVKNKN